MLATGLGVWGRTRGIGGGKSRVGEFMAFLVSATRGGVGVMSTIGRAVLRAATTGRRGMAGIGGGPVGRGGKTECIFMLEFVL